MNISERLRATSAVLAGQTLPRGSKREESPLINDVEAQMLEMKKKDKRRKEVVIWTGRLTRPAKNRPKV